ncbi:hypothetical protein PMHK_05730 [Pseudomonas sp. MHK4]
MTLSFIVKYRVLSRRAFRGVNIYMRPGSEAWKQIAVRANQLERANRFCFIRHFADYELSNIIHNEFPFYELPWRPNDLAACGPHQAYFLQARGTKQGRLVETMQRGD